MNNREIIEIIVQEFEARYDDAANLLSGTFHCSSDIFEWLQTQMPSNQESFWVLLLNNKHRLLRRIRVTKGLVNRSLVHPREVFREAIKDTASAVILAHNHPSGCPEPSVEDVRITERLVDAGRIIGIQVLDHLILGDGTYYSFSDNQRI